ncbi:hypothetical protein JCM6882_005339 [Rhodosporidiobolus microsporus]
MTLRSSNSWLGELAKPSVLDTKFSTVALGGGRNRGRPGLFDEDLLPTRRSGSRSRIDEELEGIQGLENAGQGAWIVTVAEGPKARSRGRKPDPVLTVYVSTPTSSLTLSRKLSEIVDLEARLRAQFPGRLPSRKPSAPPPTAPPATPKKRSNVLASLTRTLSPRRGGPTSFTSFGAASKDRAAAAAIDVKEFGALLTKASHDSTVRAHHAWRAFFVVGKDDLESSRVERRIKRARSDQTMHLADTSLDAQHVDMALEVPSGRQSRQDASNGSAMSGVTEEIVKTPGVERLDSLFDLGEIPSATIRMGTPAPVEDVELRDAGRGDESEPLEEEPSVEKMDESPARPAPAAPLPAAEPSSPSPIPVESVEAPAPVEHVAPNGQDRPAPSNDQTPAPAPKSDGAVASAQPDEFVSVSSSTASKAAVKPISKAPSPGEVKKAVKPQNRKTSAPAKVPPSASAPSFGNLSAAAMSRSRSDLTTASSAAKKSFDPDAVSLDSFDILRVLGKGCAGKVLMVREKRTSQILALKAITKRHVLAHRELHHTRTEQSVLKRCARHGGNPFICKLHYSFHDADTLYLALDFHSGGDLATQLARWGRLGRDRTRFYMAEIVDGVEGLHRAGIIYRDLKPENVLISHDGHIVLTDFGLSKDFGHKTLDPPATDGLPRPHWLDQPSRSVSTPPASAWLFGRRETTTSFCGTAEYLAPEVLLGEPYSYEVDTWSAGTMLYEMLTGITPFYAEDHATMYKRVLHDDLTFDEARIFDNDTKALIRGMLHRDPLLRMTDARIRKHKYWAGVDFDLIRLKRYQPPFVPDLNREDPTDVSQFDEAFLSLPAQVKGGDSDDEPGADRDPPEGEPQAPFDDQGRDVFDGYSYFGRDSASIHRLQLEDEKEDAEAKAGRRRQSKLVEEVSDRVDSDEEASMVEETDSQEEEEEETDEEEETEEEEEEEEEEGEEPSEAEEEEPTTEEDPTAEPSKRDSSGGESNDARAKVESSPIEVKDDSPGDKDPSSTDSQPQTPHVERADFLTSTPPPAPHTRGTSADTTLSNEVSGDLSLSSIATISTVATTAFDSPNLARINDFSSHKNLSPLVEEKSVSSAAAPPSNAVLVEEPEEPSDSEWDVVESQDVGQSARNGGREATFFSRGIKDRYRLVLAPLGSPLRPPPISRTSRQNSRKGSSSSAHSGLSSLSPTTSTTPEPSSNSLSRPIGAMRRLGSMRSSTSGNGGSGSRDLRNKRSQRSLGSTTGGTRTAPPSPRIDTKLFKRGMSTSASTGLLEATPRKREAFKNFARSAFLSSSNNGGGRPGKA